MVMAGMTIGSIIGGSITLLVTPDLLVSIIGSTIGGFLGIYVAFKLSQNI